LLKFFLAKILLVYQNGDVLTAKIRNSQSSRSKFSHVEARMSGKVKSKQIQTGGFALSSNRVFIFTFIFILNCVLLLVPVGCESPEMKAAEAERARKLPPDVRKVNIQNSLEQKFENPVAHYELAQIYHAEGNWADAEYHYNIALSFDPSNADAKVSMVKLFLDSGDTAKSKNYANNYINAAGNSDIQSSRLAMAFEKQQLDEYALTCYQQALNLSPDSARINKQLAHYYLGKGDKERAKEYLVRSFQLDPTQPEVAGELGKLGVEVKIPGRTEAETRKLLVERKYRMVMRHGRVQFEPLDDKSE
jgi:tetratricopeptide (TPR) repeat protein